jgi:magnesium-protoporphyrin O-methyltransferase
MVDCQCQGIEDLFNEKNAAKELELYRKRGPDKTTRMLIDALKAEGVRDLSLLDIGGGVGAIQHELLEVGAQAALDIDASQAYLNAAREEAARRGLAERVDYQYGNFVELAEQVPSADIVTLDRVICCYPDMVSLVSLSAARAKKLYGVVYPRDSWWIKLALSIMNVFFRLQGNPYRAFVHPTRAVEAIILGEGFEQRYYKNTLIWQVAVYAC